MGFIYPCVCMFYMMLVLSVFICLSSCNWLVAWVSMELNMLCFLPLITLSGGGVEGAGKYFLAQAGGSALFLFSPVMWSLELCNFMMLSFVSGLLLKLGGAPMHYWFPSVCSGLDWGVNLILMTLQKVSPMVILFTMISFDRVSSFIFLGLVGLFFGALGGLMQTQLRPLFAYSSISHMGWMLSLLCFSAVGFITYFIVYCVILIPLFLSFYYSKMVSVKMMNYFSCLKADVFLLMSIFIISLAGFPPLSGFFMKAYGVFLLVSKGLFFVGLLFISLSILSLIFYINIVFMGMVVSSFNFIVKVEGVVMSWFFGFASSVSLVGFPIFSLLVL